MDIKHIAVVGTGSMGSMMSLLFAENGLQVSIYDPSTKNLDTAVDRAKTAKLDAHITSYHDYKSLCNSLGSPHPKVFLLSVPRGTVGDGIVDSLSPYLVRGDIIIDASNEWYLNTQRRQGKMSARGVHYISTGVSGGYQSARSGPSMSPSSDESALKAVMPLLKRVAAKDATGNDTPCVTMIGPGGSWHYVKMIHNGIEQGMLGALCEVWGLMHRHMGLNYDQIANEFHSWNNTGNLKNNFLIGIGIDICRTTDPESGKPMVERIKDKVVQEVDESEGTGVWTCSEGIRLHVRIPTITAAHQLRLGSAYEEHRNAVSLALDNKVVTELEAFESDNGVTEKLRSALYVAFLAAFIQGLALLARADEENGWGLDFVKIIRIWSIIRSEFISDFVEVIYKYGSRETKATPLAHAKIAAEFRQGYSLLKEVVLKAICVEAPCPTLGATLEWLKYSTRKNNLPTDFMEAELDYFGAHDFELEGGPATGLLTGPYHFRLKSAKDVPEEKKIEKV